MRIPAEGIVHGKDGKELVGATGNVNWPGQQDAGRDLYARLTQLLQDGSIKVRLEINYGCE